MIRPKTFKWNVARKHTHDHHDGKREKLGLLQKKTTFNLEHNLNKYLIFFSIQARAKSYYVLKI